MAVTDASPPPRRWTLRTIRCTIEAFRGLTLGGVWRGLQRCGVGPALGSFVVPEQGRNENGTP